MIRSYTSFPVLTVVKVSSDPLCWRLEISEPDEEVSLGNNLALLIFRMHCGI